jgi:hypothetical protein
VNCWVGKEEEMNPPRSVQLGSDLKFFDQTISRLSSEFGFVSDCSGDLDDDDDGAKGSK